MIYIGVNNCYWLTTYNVTNLGGNKFINGLIFGMADMCSSIFSGVLMSYVNPFTAFRICALISVIFNALNQFLVPFGTFASYLTLAVAILGVGGVYTCIFVMVGLVLPSDQKSGAMIIIVTIGASLSIGAPMIIVLDSPYPFFFLSGFMVVSIATSFRLK